MMLLALGEEGKNLIVCFPFEISFLHNVVLHTLSFLALWVDKQRFTWY